MKQLSIFTFALLTVLPCTAQTDSRFPAPVTIERQWRNYNPGRVHFVIENPESEGAKIYGAIVKNPDRYKNALSAEFEMSAEKADEFYEAPENWLAFDQIITLKNQSDKDLTVYGFEVKDNGKDGFYVCTKVGGEIGMVPGASGTSSFTILCENGELSVDEAKAAIDKMEIKAIYSRTPEEFDDGTESTEETKTVEIVFPEDK